MMAVDKSKLGEAYAQAIDSLERHEKAGELDGYELDEVLVVIAFKRPSPDVSELEPNKTEIFMFVEGTTQIPYVQHGMLLMAAEIGDYE